MILISLCVFPGVGSSLVAQTVKNPLQCGRPGFDPWIGKVPWRRAWQPTPVFLGFPCGFFSSKEPVCSVGDLGSIPGLGRSVGKWKGYPLLYSGLENSMDCIVHGVAKSQTQLSIFHFHLLYKSLLSLIRSDLSVFVFISIALDTDLRKHCCSFFRECFAYDSLQEFYGAMSYT